MSERTKGEVLAKRASSCLCLIRIKFKGVFIMLSKDEQTKLGVENSSFKGVKHGYSF